MKKSGEGLKWGATSWNRNCKCYRPNYEKLRNTWQNAPVPRPFAFKYENWRKVKVNKPVNAQQHKVSTTASPHTFKQ